MKTIESTKRENHEKVSKREHYARDFVTEFAAQFVNILDNPQSDQFTITRQRFGEFLLKYDYLPDDWDSLPTKQDVDRWRSFRHWCTMIRQEMNGVSRLGLHGEPPFEAVVEGRDRSTGDITIRSLQRMAMVTYKEVGDAIEKHLRSKAKYLRQTHSYLMEPAQLDRLPVGLHSRLMVAEGMFNMAVKHATMGIEDYLKYANKVAMEANKQLESN